MKNWKRILAAVGTAALLVSNVGAVSQVVFADEGDIVESVAENVVDVSEGDVSAQVQEIIDEAIAVSEEPSDESQQDQPEIPAESTEVITEGTTESEPAEETPAPTDPIETPEPVEGDETTADDETVSDESATTEDDEEIVDETVEDETVVDETTVDETVEDETDVDEDPADEETEEEPLVSPEYESQVKVESKNGNSGITVHATAEENVIPEGAILVARLIEEDTKEYQEVEQALIDSEDVDYTGETQTAATSDDADDDEDADDSETVASEGFIAMDIHFEVKQPVKNDEAQTEDAENPDTETEDADDASTETDDDADIEYEYVEVEPKGFVNITFDLEENVLPVEADPDTLTVHHIVEDEDGNVDKIETVADTKPVDEGGADGDVTSGDASGEDTSPAVNAEFQVESFSTFTITFTYGIGGSDEEIHFFYVDENGKDIAPETWVSWTIEEKTKMEDQIDLQYFIRDIDGYMFKTIQIKDGEKDQSPKDFRYIVWGTYAARQYFWPEWIKSWNDDKAEFGYDNKNKFDNDAYVYIVYEPYTYSEKVTAPQPALGVDKKVIDKNDGTFDLTINVSSKGENSNKQKIDILFVVDTSSSMIKGWDDGVKDKNKTSNDKLRADAAREAVLAAMSDIKKNTGVDAHYGLVTFSTFANHDNYHQDFRNNESGYDDLVALLKGDGFSGKHKGASSSGNPKDVEGYKAYVGDTNYDAAVLAIGEKMDRARTDAKKIVIVLTDGIATCAYNSDGTIWGNGHSYSSKDDPQSKPDLLRMTGRAVDHMDGIDLSTDTGDAFYVVGIGVDDYDFNTFTKPLAVKAIDLDNGQYSVTLENLKNKKETVTLDGNAFVDGVVSDAFNTTGKTDLLITKIRKIIADSLLTVNAENVHISDPLSDYVEVTKTENKYNLTVVVTDKDGESVDTDAETPDVQVQRKEGYDEKTQKYKYTYTYTATPDVVEENGHQKITLEFKTNDANAPAYQLESGWNYKVTAKVKPTEAAYKYYRDNELYDTSKNADGTLIHDYPDIADKDTGTYAEKRGLYTNGYTHKDTVTNTDIEEKAELTYYYTGSNGGTVKKSTAEGTVNTTFLLNDSAYIASDGRVVAKVIVSRLGNKPNDDAMKAAIAKTSIKLTIKDNNGNVVKTKTLPLKDYTATAGNNNIVFNIRNAISDATFNADTNTVEIVNVISEERDYAKPVIQLNPGKLVITKTITGLNAGSDAMTSAVGNTQFTVSVKNANNHSLLTTTDDNGTKQAADSKTIKLTDTTVEGGTITNDSKGKYTITFYGLDPDSSYTVTEQKVATNTNKPGEITNWTVKNYVGTDTSEENTGVKSTDGSNNTVDTRIKWNTESSASFTNKYEQNVVKTGVVTDNNMFPALVATIDIMAAMFVVYGIAKRRVR